MTGGYKIDNQSGVYFLTFQIIKWIDLFTRLDYRDIIIDSFQFCQKNKELNIHAYVIMSNHIHVVLSAENNNLSDTIRDFKTYTSKTIIKTIKSIEESRSDWMLNLFEFEAKKQKRNDAYQVWTHDNHPEELISNHFIDQKIDYIHQNPVVAAIVDEAEDYIYSSARNYAGEKGLIEIDFL